MKVIQGPICILLIFLVSTYGEQSFEGLISEKCPLTEYKTYIKCVEKFLSLRKNVSEILSSPCKLCNCGLCDQGNPKEFFRISCCKHCCSFKPCVTSHCCFQTCHPGCKTPSCRNLCIQSCIQYIDDFLKKRRSSKQRNYSHVFNNDALNITTKINLNNIINNTNNLNFPVRLASTNLNNISIDKFNEQTVEVIIPTYCGSFWAAKCLRKTGFRFKNCILNEKSCGNLCRKSYNSTGIISNGRCRNLLNLSEKRYQMDINRTNSISNNNSLPVKISTYSPYIRTYPMPNYFASPYTDSIPTYFQLHSNNFLNYPYQFYPRKVYTPYVFIPANNLPPRYFPYFNSFHLTYMKTPNTFPAPLDFQSPYMPIKSPQIFNQDVNLPMAPMKKRRYLEYPLSSPPL